MISQREFDNAIKEATTMSKWRDLEVGRIYKIVDYHVFECEKMKLTLEDGQKKLYTMWAPQRVKETLEDRDYTHIRSNGLIQGQCNKHWSFNVVKIEKKDMFS